MSKCLPSLLILYLQNNSVSLVVEYLSVIWCFLLGILRPSDTLLSISTYTSSRCSSLLTLCVWYYASWLVRRVNIALKLGAQEGGAHLTAMATYNTIGYVYLLNSWVTERCWWIDKSFSFSKMFLLQKWELLRIFDLCTQWKNCGCTYINIDLFVLSVLREFAMNIPWMFHLVLEIS